MMSTLLFMSIYSLLWLKSHITSRLGLWDEQLLNRIGMQPVLSSNAGPDTKKKSNSVGQWVMREESTQPNRLIEV